MALTLTDPRIVEFFHSLGIMHVCNVVIEMPINGVVTMNVHRYPTADEMTRLLPVLREADVAEVLIDPMTQKRWKRVE